ncbi:MAG: hypothetical protein K1W02_03800 [Muribaculaceae bacterium]
MTESEIRLRLLESRHSVRSFTENKIDANIANKLRAEISMTNSHEQGMRFQLVLDDAAPFKGYGRSYGIFENARNYLAAVVDVATPDAYERAGYFAERFVVKAISLGLGTCFVGGTFDTAKAKVQVRAGERILFLVAIGMPSEKERPVAAVMRMIAHRKKMTYSDFFIPSSDIDKASKIYPFIIAGLKAVACAPSALNRRPVRIHIKQEESSSELCAFVKEDDRRMLIDLGIAKYNFNYATSTCCDWGNDSSLICDYGKNDW